DGNGNAATKPGLTFGWSLDDRLTSVSGSVTASYIYDYQGRRSSKTAGSQTTYLYDDSNLIHEGGASSADYVFGPSIDEPLAMSRGGSIYYYVTDALGSVNAITDSSATVRNTYLYDAWGQIKSQTGSLVSPFTYTAREAGEAGLIFNRARYYQPSVGRFLSEDRTGVEVTDRLYTYGGLSPLAFTDPTGMVTVNQTYEKV